MFWSADDQDPGGSSCLQPNEGAVVDDIKANLEDTSTNVSPTMGDAPPAHASPIGASRDALRSLISGAATAPELTDNRSVVEWWEYHVKISGARSKLLGTEIDPVTRRQPREQLTVGLAVHFGAIDGVVDNCSDKLTERFSRISDGHAQWLEATARDAHATEKVLAPTDPNDPIRRVFPRRVRVEDCWRVMSKYSGAYPDGRFHYSPGNFVEVLGNDMAWHPGVVTYSRSYQEGLGHESQAVDGGDAGDDEETDGGVGGKKSLMVNVIRPNGQIEYGNLENEVRPSEEAIRVLFGRAPWLWQQHALLRAEKLARFEENHPEDFNEIDWTEWGRKEFMAWVNGPARPKGPDDNDDGQWASYLESTSVVDFNPKFGEYYRAFPEGVQAALLTCLLEPFLELDLITGGEDDEGWDFDEEACRIVASSFSCCASGSASGIFLFLFRFRFRFLFLFLFPFPFRFLFLFLVPFPAPASASASLLHACFVNDVTVIPSARRRQNMPRARTRAQPLSCYTYVSVCGSGHIVSLAIAAVQVSSRYTSASLSDEKRPSRGLFLHAGRGTKKRESAHAKLIPQFMSGQRRRSACRSRSFSRCGRTSTKILAQGP